MLTAERGVQMRTRFRGRLAWENMSVWLRGGRVFSPGPDSTFFTSLYLLASLFILVSFVSLFISLNLLTPSRGFQDRPGEENEGRAGPWAQCGCHVGTTEVVKHSRLNLVV